jgi:hypothetical protein
MDYKPDNSGIRSLEGFSFQIKVFCCFASKLQEGQQIEFEAIDDIAKCESATIMNIDDIDAKILSPVYEAIQVKHTKLTKSLAKKVLLNWIQIENSQYHVSKYILILDSKNGNTDEIKNIDIDNFINEIMKSKLKEHANISKVKRIFESKSDVERKDIIKKVLDKYELQDKDIGQYLTNSFKDIFLKSANEVVFYQRVEDFIKEITYKILKSVNTLQPYSLNYENFQKICENIHQKISEKIYMPEYSVFRNNNTIDLNNTVISKSREYRQLSYCDLSESNMRNYLLNELYYRKVRSEYLEDCMESRCETIEITAYENFESVKDDLKCSKEDTPKNRLKGTVEKENSYAENVQIKKGVCIHLTADSVEDKIKISWKDE